MNVAISAVRTKNIRINRHELVTSLQSLGHKVFYIGQESNDSLHPDYKKYNVKYLSIPLGRSNTNPLKEIRTILKTRKVIKENNIDTMIVYGIRTFPTIIIAAKLARVKKVVSIVNGSGRLFQLKSLKGKVIKAISYPMLWLAFLLSHKIFFQNSDDMEMIRKKLLLWRKNYEIINGSGVNLTEFQFTALENKPVFSMISRLTGNKGVNEYVKAANIVKKDFPEAIFYLIGPMDDDDTSIDKFELKKAVESGVIIFKGSVEDVRPYIEKSRVFVLPSYYPEGIPRSILEAMAMGRPIITTNSSGCKETVVNGENGFKVIPRNPEELASKMIWMITNREQTTEMGKKSRLLAERKFDVYKINQMIIEAIRI